MANRTEHGVAGALAALAAYVLWKKSRGESLTLFGTMGSLLSGSAISSVPDEIEPATNPNHRGTFHSLTLATVIGLALKKILASQTVNPAIKLASIILSAGYGSHLALDSGTTKGLPLI